MIERELRQQHERLVEYQRRRTDRRLDPAVKGEQVLRSRAPAAREPRPERHAAHESGEHEGLGKGGCAEEEFQVVRPDRFVDEAGEAGKREQGKQQVDALVRHIPFDRPRKCM